MKPRAALVNQSIRRPSFFVGRWGRAFDLIKVATKPVLHGLQSRFGLCRRYVRSSARRIIPRRYDGFKRQPFGAVAKQRLKQIGFHLLFSIMQIRTSFSTSALHRHENNACAPILFKRPAHYALENRSGHQCCSMNSRPSGQLPQLYIPAHRRLASRWACLNRKAISQISNAH